MSGFVNRIKSWVTGDDYDVDVYSIDDEFGPDHGPLAHTPAIHHEEPLMERPMAPPSRHSSRHKALKVLDSPQATQAAQVMVIEPKAFEESLEIVEQLRQRKSVILNLHLLDTAQSQRVVDFLSGATHAIDGHQQRIGDGVFIFTPSNVSIATEAEKKMEFSTDAFWKQGGR